VIEGTYWIPRFKAMLPGISVMMYGGKTGISHVSLRRGGMSLQRRVMMEYLSPKLVPRALSMPASRAFLTISSSTTFLSLDLRQIGSINERTGVHES